MKQWPMLTKNKTALAGKNKRISQGADSFIFALKTGENYKVTTFQVLYFMVI